MNLVFFSPQRLTFARELRNLTQTELGEKIGITDSSISNYERGARVPDAETIAKLADVLEFPVGFFSLSDIPMSEAPIFYRSKQTNTQIAQKKTSIYFPLIYHLFDFLSTYLKVPETNLPKIGNFPNDPEEITDDMVRYAAKVARDFWRLGNDPVPNLVWLLEKSGIVIFKMDLGTDKMDAATTWWWDGTEKRYFIILNSVQKNSPRLRANVAHELGHILLHSNIDKYALNKKSQFKQLEEQAWLFAQEFLLPKSFLEEAYSLNLGFLASLKPKWKVSVAFMLERFRKLDVLSDEAYVNARKNLARKGWLQIEPYDMEMKVEKPLLLIKMIEHLFENKRSLSEAHVRDATQLPDHILGELLQSNKTYFTNSESEVKSPFDTDKKNITKPKNLLFG